jgi:hypothetical protein
MSTSKASRRGIKMSDANLVQLVTAGTKVPTAFFLDANGSCCAAVLDYHLKLGKDSPLEPKLIVTSGLEGNRAYERTQDFKKKGIPLESVDTAIEEFHRRLGYVNEMTKRGIITLKTSTGRAYRDLWTTNVLLPHLRARNIKLGVFGGFEPMTNMVAAIPCLNTHPGDLTYLKDGRRYLVGWMTMPIERAIFEGHKELRTTVILAMPYDRKDPMKSMDNGVITGISAGVPIDLYGHSLEELKKIADARPAQRPRDGFKDVLEEIASKNQTALKKGGDYIALPAVTMDVARGYLTVNEFPSPSARLFFSDTPEDKKSFRQIEHIIYHRASDGGFEREIIEKKAA